MNKVYLLYSDKEKTDLLAVAETEEQRDEITQEYTEGFWYQYDMVSGSETVFTEDTEQAINVIFPETASVKEVEVKEENYWKSVAGSNLR